MSSALFHPFGLFRGHSSSPGPTPPPTQDTAANANLQQQAQLLRRRGIMGNIFAGSNASTPATASKTALGN
jgi:hypothetical protein